MVLLNIISLDHPPHLDMLQPRWPVPPLQTTNHPTFLVISGSKNRSSVGRLWEGTNPTLICPLLPIPLFLALQSGTVMVPHSVRSWVAGLLNRDEAPQMRIRVHNTRVVHNNILVPPQTSPYSAFVFCWIWVWGNVSSSLPMYNSPYVHVGWIPRRRCIWQGNGSG